MDPYIPLAKLFGISTVAIGAAVSAFWDYLQADVATPSNLIDALVRGGVIGMVGLFVVGVGLKMSMMFMDGQRSVTEDRKILTDQLMAERQELMHENMRLKEENLLLRKDTK